ncbi:MAG: DoxX family protein [Patescibacteria group bacterium]|nr:DoxX family protein [Patescibacteria group bacterium]
MKAFFNYLSRACYDKGLGLLLIRVIAGLIFTVHGWEKWQNIDSTIRLMALLNLGGAPTAYFIASLELLGGIALILGVFTRVFGVLFGIEMAVAAIIAGAPRGFGGYEFEMLLSAVSFGLALAGSGKFSLLKMECAHCGGILCSGKPPECPAH